MNIANFFLKGLNKTLKLINGTNFSYAGPWAGAPADKPTIIDTWYVGEFMSADYTIVVDQQSNYKEVIKCLVVASPQLAAVTVYGRTDLNGALVDVTATVNNSKVSVIVTPIENSKVIFSANYYQSINTVTPA